MLISGGILIIKHKKYNFFLFTTSAVYPPTITSAHSNKDDWYILVRSCLQCTIRLMKKTKWKSYQVDATYRNRGELVTPLLTYRNSIGSTSFGNFIENFSATFSKIPSRCPYHRSSDNNENCFWSSYRTSVVREEGLITFDMIDFVRSLHDHGTFIPYEWYRKQLDGSIYGYNSAPFNTNWTLMTT